jgi:D-beta-D-heptose 7-phosphate kinase/D-beta-D-heptose 1-phosphate adenosyltransferase
MSSSKESLRSFLARARKRGDRIVFTNGCFDVLHAGHVRYLKQARRLGDALIVGLNSDASVRRLKGSGRPVNSQSDRREVLSALSCVDFVQPFSEDTPAALIRRVRPDVLVKGGDWPVHKIVGHEFVASYGGRTRVLPFLRGRSTTQTLEKIKRLG